MAPVLFVVGIIAVVALAIYFGWYAKKKRREELAGIAASLGLEYSANDPYGFDSYPFELFGRGDGQGTENVLTGTWQGTHLNEFDFWYYDQSTDSNGRTSRTYHRFSCALTELPIDGAALTVGPETLFTRMADHLGFHDIEFEDETFNREFRVKCQDRKFATDLVDARMMQWLAGTGGWSFELSGPYLLCYRGRLKPTELIPLLGTLKAFCDHIPRVVYDLYGTERRPEGSEAQ